MFGQLNGRRIALPDEPVILATNTVGRDPHDPKFFGSSPPPLHWRWQVWHDSWRNKDRDCRWYGTCLGCGRNVWAFDDGENDPRGVLGDSALWTVEVEDGYEVRACAVCANDEPMYRLVMRRGDKRTGLVDARPLIWPGVE